MALGTGKYDELCTTVREQTEAAAVLVMVMGGKKGNGFSVQAAPDLLSDLPGLLRRIADQIEADLRS